MDQHELEDGATKLIGKIIFEFSRFEFHLGLALRNALMSGDADLANPVVDRLTFKAKLDAFREVVQKKYASQPACVDDFKCWHQSMDKIRLKRNSFVHGRWGLLAHAGKVANVSPGMPGSDLPKETFYTLSDLQHELGEVIRVRREFGRLLNKWKL